MPSLPLQSPKHRGKRSGGNRAFHYTATHSGGLTLGGYHSQSHMIIPLHKWTGRENITEGSGVEIRAGRGHSLITVMGKTDSICRY